MVLFFIFSDFFFAFLKSLTSPQTYINSSFGVQGVPENASWFGSLLSVQLIQFAPSSLLNLKCTYCIMHYCTLHVAQSLVINKIKVSNPSCPFFWQLHISNQMQQLLRTQSWYGARNQFWQNKELNCSTMKILAEGRRFFL